MQDVGTPGQYLNRATSWGRQTNSTITTEMYTRVLFLLTSIVGYNNAFKYIHDDTKHLQYHGPTAIPHVLKNGHIADTHEVAVAKAEHLAAVSKAKTYGGHGYGDHGYARSHDYGHGHEYSYDNHDHILYHGPTAIPHVLKNGHIADTHEVAVAKAEYLAAVSKAKAHYYSDGYSGGLTGGYAGGYHRPLAKPVVLQSGYLADTHEVSAAKEHHLHALHNRTIDNMTTITD